MTTQKSGLATDRLLTTPEVARYLGVPVATVYQWRTRGTAPPAVRVGKHLRFRHADVDGWIERHVDGTRGAA